MDRAERIASLVASYDAHAQERETSGEPDWRNNNKDDFASRVPAGGKLLEVGAGVGYTSRWFADRGLDVIATDLAPVNVELCRQKGLVAEVRDIADLGFATSSFDGVWAASCLMHIPNAELPAAIEEIRRVVKDDGHFWAGTWGGADDEGVWDDDWYQPKRFYSIRSDARMREYYEPFFEVLSFEVFDPRPDLDWHYQSALLRAA